MKKGSIVRIVTVYGIFVTKIAALTSEGIWGKFRIEFERAIHEGLFPFEDIDSIEVLEGVTTLHSTDEPQGDPSQGIEITFQYKGEKDWRFYTRTVRLLKIGTDYIEGLDVDDNYTFKRFLIDRMIL